MKFGDRRIGRAAATVGLAATMGAAQAQSQDVKDQIAQLTTQQQMLTLQMQLLQTQHQILAAQRNLGDDAQRTADVTQQAALVNAMVSLQTAQSNLAKGDIDASAAITNSQKALQDAQNALLASQLKSDFVAADVLKGYFTAATGKEGNITLKEGGARLMQAAVSSAVASNILAGQLCKQLARANVQKAVVVDISKLAQIEEAKLVESSFADIQARLNRTSEAVAKVLDGPAPDMKMFGVQGLGVLAAIPYIAGGIQAVTKLFRTDRDLVVGSDPARAELFATLLGTHKDCENVIANPVPDYLALNVGPKLGTLRTKFQDLVVVNAAASELGVRAEAEMKRLEGLLDPKPAKEGEAGKPAAEKPKPPLSPQQAAAARKRLLDLRRAYIHLKANLEGAKGFMDSVKPGADNKLMIHASLLTIGAAIHGKPRLIMGFASQDVQETKTSTWSSAQSARMGTAQVSYRVLSSDNESLLAGGFLSYSTKAEDLDFEKKDEVAFGHKRPSAPQPPVAEKPADEAGPGGTVLK